MPGLYFEDFEIGQVFRHAIRRTVTETDNVLFSTLTMNPQPLHLDRHFCETQTEWGRPLADAGIVDFAHRAYNQDDALVAECRRQAFMKRRPA
jgi:acyl dehydratase